MPTHPVRLPDTIADGGILTGTIPRPRDAAAASRMRAPEVTHARHQFYSAVLWRRIARDEAREHLQAANRVRTVGQRRTANEAWDTYAQATHAVRVAARRLARERKREATKRRRAAAA